ncbi:histidine kinase dimerization/phosphoacceptor domain -containing protein [Flavobacterium pectinovorum]|uniref:histidine kinase dimerization/phosphoacceptor domain -containing protein n=1 Tax=Flavobacterium pectinovorum TaxID=29533 RepID=UPI001FADEE21|nr:histidine kinase dimerization/phosphoacceptor domain -containing protein [Flavobacterium pectinovorum]MCI9846827.1 hypothetical protein [Flavobacterium pectinovorum]
MDSARFNFNKASILSQKIKNQDLIHECLFYYGEVLFEENNYTMAIKNFDKIIAFYQKNNRFEKEAKMWEVLGARLFWKFPRSFNTLEKSANYFDKASLLYKNLGLQEKYAYAVKSKADAHLNQGRLDLAEKELLQVLDIYNKIGYKKLHFTYDLLADTQRLKGDLGKSLNYSLLCVKSMESTGDYRFAPDFYEQLAVAYKDLGNHQLSIELLKKAISILKSDKEADFANLYEFTDLLSKELCEVNQHKEALHQVQKIIKEYPPKENVHKARILGSLAYCYNKNKQVELAESNYLKMIHLYEKKGHGFYIINLSEAYFQLGKFYQEHKKYEKAKNNFEKSLNFSKGIVELNQVKEANLYLFKIDSVQGKYFSAIKYFQKYKNLNDSIFNEKKNKQIEELQILYGLEKKEKEFSNLKLAMDAEKEKTTQAQNMIKFGAGIVLLLLACIVVFWKGYQSKQKNNKLLISQKNEIDQKNSALQKLVSEKESLMKEIHHRVKNNLQIVMSLLSSQSNTLKNKEAFDAIQKSQQRLYAISLLHQKLYKTDIVREIEMKNYIDDLLHNFADTFDLENRIHFEIEVEAIELDEAQAVSVGLILNETVTNSIKHAFPDKNQGTIAIVFKSQDSNKILFQISDNGIGLPEDFCFDASSTLGISLIKGLAEQLDGEVSFINDNGLTVRVEFIRSLVLKQ